MVFNQIAMCVREMVRFIELKPIFLTAIVLSLCRSHLFIYLLHGVFLSLDVLASGVIVIVPKLFQVPVTGSLLALQFFPFSLFCDLLLQAAEVILILFLVEQNSLRCPVT